jgi:hypothetical protein
MLGLSLGAIALAAVGMKSLGRRRGVEADTADVASFRL